MTDTTDTAALREACEILNDHGYLTKSGKIRSSNLAEAVSMIIEQSVGYADQLEAERQRSTGSEEELHKALHREKAAERKLLAAQEEIAELKGKLANPVVLTDCTFEAVSHMAHWYSEGECVAWVSGAEHVKKQILEAGFTVKGE